MPQKTAARLRELIEELARAQSESGDIAEKARHEVAGVLRSGRLLPVGTSGRTHHAKKGRKKR